MILPQDKPTSELQGKVILSARVSDRIWDPDTGNCEAVLSGHGGTIGSLCAIAWRSPAANFNGALRGGQTIPREEESRIVSGSGDSTVRVWGRVAGTTGSSGEWACRAVLEGHRYVRLFRPCICAALLLSRVDRHQRRCQMRVRVVKKVSAFDLPLSNLKPRHQAWSVGSTRSISLRRRLRHRRRRCHR